MAEAATLPARRASGTLRARLSAWRQWPRETRDTLFQLALITWIVIPHLGHLAGWCCCGAPSWPSPVAPCPAAGR